MASAAERFGGFSRAIATARVGVKQAAEQTAATTRTTAVSGARTATKRWRLSLLVAGATGGLAAMCNSVVDTSSPKVPDGKGGTVRVTYQGDERTVVAGRTGAVVWTAAAVAVGVPAAVGAVRAFGGKVAELFSAAPQQRVTPDQPLPDARPRFSEKQ